MKNYLSEEFFDSAKRLLRKMRTTCILLFVFASSLYATNVNSQVAKVNIQLKNAPLIQVIRTIENQTDYLFVYDKNEIDLTQQVNINAEDQSVTEVLTQIFSDAKVEYGMVGSNIVLMPAKSFLQQAQAVSGRVTDSSGEPLPGVTILIKGTTHGSITDFDGRYTISNVPAAGTLVFSFVGMKSQEIVLANQPTINVVMEEDAIGIEEVVAIGYGSQSKKELTGAVTGVKYEDFNHGSINSPAQLLQGKVAGLNIVAPQGNPNGSFEIRLRGLSTLGANTQPLIIIDGVIGADLNSVDPNDIAAMDVLKDAAAASIYGTRGSSGVILITTKTGTKGKAKVDYNGYVTTEATDRTHPSMNLEDYLANGGTDLSGNTVWMDEITRTAISQIHNLSLSGGTDQTTYRASFNYRDIDGVLLNTGFKQINGRLNLSQKALNDKLTLTLNLAATSKEAQLGFDYAFRSAIVMPPSAPIYSSEPYYSKYGGYFQSEVHELYNPLAIVKQNTNEEKISRLMYNLQADYKPIEKLTASVRYAQNTDDSTRGQYISKYSYYGSGVDRNGLATRASSNLKNELFEVTGNYVESFNDLNFVLLGGYSYQSLTNENFHIQGGNFLTDAFKYNNLAASKDIADGKAIATSSKENNKLIAFFGRVNLNYDNTFFLSASLRREGSTRFGEGNKWGNFPGVSTGVDLSQLVSIPGVDQFKVRASYGVTGALPGESYLSQQLYGPGGSTNYFFYNGEFTPVYSPQSNPNPDLKWETKSEIDFGIDFSLFDSRITGTFDYYNRKTTDALITLNVPVPPNLYPTSVLNAGELKNEGIEIALNYQAIKKEKFSWTPSVTFATYNSKIVSLSLGDIRYGVREIGGLPAPLAGNIVRVEEGKPIGQMIGWIYEGVDADGKYILKDVDANQVVNEDDVTIIGRGLPKGEIGFSNHFTFGKFDLSFLFRGVYGHDLLNLNRTIFEQVSRISSYNLINTKYFDPSYKGASAYNSYYLEDASFVKLDNFTVGYNFKFPVHNTITAARAYVSGQNLFYITNYTGVDPEVRYTYGGNVLVPGVEPLDSWVTTRTFTFGINLSF